MLLAVATLLMKAVAFFKDIQVAGVFGTDSNLDSFLLVFGLYGTIGNIIGGSLAVSAMPQIAAAKDVRIHWAMYLSGLRHVLLFSVGLVLVTLIFSEAVFSVVAPGVIALPESRLLELVPVIAPCAIACALVMYMQAFLNLEGIFFRPAIVQVIMPAIQLLALVQKSWPIRIETLAWATVVGYLVQVVLLAGIVWNARRKSRMTVAETPLNTTRASIYLAPTLSIALSSILIGSTDTIIGAFASTFGAGFVSALNFASKYPSLVSSFILATVITAAYPKMTRQFANGDISHFSGLVKKLGALMFTTGLVVLIFFYIFGADIVRITFERGVFDASTTAKVSDLQFVIAMQLPILLTGMVLTRAASAMQGTTSMIVASCAALVACASFLNSSYCNERTFALVYLVIQSCATGLLAINLTAKLYLPRLKK